MSEKKEEKKPNLGNYLAYGMTFGALAGALLSAVAMMMDFSFLQIAGPGIGLSIGIIIGALVYALETKDS
ncbi:hypothetical protein [Mesobacillus maritimus]|uniref:Uncharacterized protein n=1 Tax=Mesobacillus maritimus TaxID=1643336 RepID=A0ABS7K0S8_9BACI|nr:hypothetical protein [Mesobacillus maritimus]MBY0095735.1 hypothetical protein [Mesobacillus maritimus]